ncbi:MAG: hypothetical protein WD401_02860 [Thermomicrobiaceae bacterium]
MYSTDGDKLQLGRDSCSLIRVEETAGVLELVAESTESERSGALLRAGREMMLV